MTLTRDHAQDRGAVPVVGESVTRIDAVDKVTGAAIFTDDIQHGPGLLYARILRSPHPNAEIKSIDVSKAEKLPGVKAVVTGESFPGYLGLYLQDRHIFCRDRVRYVGDPVAGVAATSEEIAEKALALIQVEYEVLPPVLDPEFGATPEAPLLHPKLADYVRAPFILPQPGTNLSNHFKIRKGDADSAWADCATIVERKYRVPHIQHVPIEPHIAVAKAEQNGKITLWASTQSPFAQRNLIAKALDISQSDVRVIGPFIGGGGMKAAQHRVDPQNQLFQVKGLAQIIVGARPQPLDAVALLAPRGQEDDRQVGRVGVCAQAPAYVDATHPRHEHVQDHQIGTVAPQHLERFYTAVRQRDTKASPPQSQLDALGHVTVVIYDQDLAHSLSSSWW
jgi:hypothetical protein